MRRTRYAERLEGTKNSYKSFSGKTKTEKIRWVDESIILKLILKKQGVDYIKPRDWVQWRSLLNSVMELQCSINGG
jgi:menaquinone-dependent protoporphyrinogen IX oxidase